MIVLLATVVVMAGCGSGGKSSPDPVEVVKSYYAAANTHNIDQAMNYVSKDAVFADATGVYRGTDIRSWLESTSERLEELSNIRASGGRIGYDFVVKSDSNGYVFNKGTDGLTIVKDGKIVFNGTERTEKLAR